MRFLYVGQVGMSLRENDQVLLMVAYQGVDSNVTARDMPVVCNFLMYSRRYLRLAQRVNINSTKVKS